MMKTHHPTLILLALLLFAMMFGLSSCKKEKTAPQPKVDPYFATTLPQYGAEAKEYVAGRNLSQDYCILVDYSIRSGLPRVFLWSFAENKVIYKAHTMHGPGKGSTPENAVLSNVPGSNCSAPGHFKITLESGATLKHSFRLMGLDKENQTAYDRGIMLHGGMLVDVNIEKKVKYLPIDKLWCAGCVTTSDEEMYYLESFIKKQPKRMLLWSFKSGTKA